MKRSSSQTIYVENWSMIADLLIAAKTVKAMISHSDAY